MVTPVLFNAGVVLVRLVVWCVVIALVLLDLPAAPAPAAGGALAVAVRNFGGDGGGWWLCACSHAKTFRL